MKNRKIKEFNKSVAVIYGSSYTTLYILRELKNHVPVVLISPDTGFAAFSKYVDQRIFIPRSNTAKLLEVFAQIGQQQQKKGVVFPTGDFIVKFCSENYQELINYFHIPITPKHTLKLINKQHQHNICDQIGIPYPKSYYINSVNCDISEIKHNALFPLIIKPTDPVIGKELFKVLLLNNLSELENIIVRYQHKKADFIVSEYIPGEPDNIWGYNGYCNQDFETIAGWSYKKLSQRPYYNGLFCSIKYQKNETVEDLSKKFIKTTLHSGNYETEFKYDYRDGNYKFIEVNPRYGRTLGVGGIEKVNLPLIHYAHETGNDDLLESLNKLQGNCIAHLVLPRCEISNMLNSRFQTKYFKNVINILIYKNKIWGVFNIQDYKPAIFFYKRLFSLGLKKLFSMLFFIKYKNENNECHSKSKKCF